MGSFQEEVEDIRKQAEAGQPVSTEDILWLLQWVSPAAHPSGLPEFASGEYIQGLTEQFGRDLLLTGRATMPDGEVVVAFPKPTGAFPELPTAAIFKKNG
jgi:hypothetical protein